ncbi:MAG: helicase, partial [Armatimonadetes bacterium]|nr:helicase [Armatimonadota bacterium]
RWASVRTVPPPIAGDSKALLYETLRAVDAEDSAAAVSAICGKVMGQTLPVEGWQEALYERLTVNELVYILAEVLKTPQPLAELLDILERRAGRRVPEEELLIWLTLGAAARLEDRALLRPVVHAFVQGVGGAVVTFPEGVERPRLWLSVEQEELHGDPDKMIHLKILTCNKCAQHYFEAWAMDFQFSDKAPMGGEAVGNHSFWPHLEEAQGGNRVILLDRLAGSGEDGEDNDEPQATAEVFLCRWCGALYPAERDKCNGCGRSGALVRLLAVQNSIKQPGKIGKCVSCGARGRFLFGSWREPIRPVRATTVADVYVLSQEMIRHAERARLLVFADNRQDAAFQAGWMGDHARRYRLRGLMWELIREGRISIGDLVAHLDERLDRDDALSKALLPEVWLIEYKTRTGHRHQEHRKYYLRLKVLLELTMSLKERTGLEPWGRMKVDYHGLDVSDAFIQEKSKSIGTTPELLLSGITCLLDIYRRQMILLDRSAKEPFTHIWMDGDWERSRGFLPEMRGVPKGLKLERGSGDDKSRIVQWLSTRNAVYHSV